MKKRIGIYSVLDKHNDLTKRMNEDARYNITNRLGEADDELNLDDPENPDTGVDGGLGLDDTEDLSNQDMPTDQQPEEDDDALDLDALTADDGTNEDIPPMDAGQPQGDFAPPMDQTEPPMGQTEPTMDMGGEPTEEIDVTDFVEKGNELTQKVDTQVQAMAQQIDSLTQKLSSMDQLLGKIQNVEDEIMALRPQKPIETLKLRSLDSYPYNQGIDDYWKQKEMEIEKLRDFNRVDDQNQEYVLTNDDVNNFSDIDMKDSLNPHKAQLANPFPGPDTNQQQQSRFNNQPRA